MTNNDNIQTLNKFATIRIDDQYFGIPVDNIIDILLPQKIYPIPLARKEIIGSINLRGRIVTTLDTRIFLDMKTISDVGKGRCIVLEHQGELFNFIVDEVGSVNNFSLDELIKTPENLSSRWQEISLGIFPVKDELIIILDINKMMNLL